MPTPQQVAAAALVAAQLEEAEHGARAALIDAACARLGCSRQTLYQWMRPHRGSSRKRRADAGSASISERDLDLIARTMREGGRANGKQILTLKAAIAQLGAQGLIQVERVNQETGEITRLSDSAISRALRARQQHPEQLNRPTPHQVKRTLHPNHEWQIDASVCVVYYLPGGGTGVVDLESAVHYKNKPENLKAIEQFRVIRYVGTDHASGVIRWRYYPHAESGAHTVDFLAWMMAPKSNPADPFHGAPKQVLVDPGATASGTVKRFAKRCEIELIVSRPHNPRAKGQVEKANDQVETVFESGLRFQRHRVTDFNALNALAEHFQLYFNATERHSRHGLTRFDAWLKIRPHELRITTGYRDLLTLASEDPKPCKVSGGLTIQYRGKQWRVKDVPGVCVGEKIAVHWSPFVATAGAPGQAVAVLTGDDGFEAHYPLAEVIRDEWGFDIEAPVSGEEFKRLPDTKLDETRKRLSRAASGTQTDQADELARRRKDFRPLADVAPNGFNPYHAAETTAPRTYIPRHGTAHGIAAARLEIPPLDHVTAAQRLKAAVTALGMEWGPERYAWLVSRYPDGVPEEAIDHLTAELTTPAAPQTHQLRAVK